jgi:uncharacterized protein YceK
MKTLLIIMITLWTLSGCGSDATTPESSTTPPQPHGIADDIKPPASPDI